MGNEYQQRVIQEKAELDDRFEKLCLFIYGPGEFSRLPLAEKNRLQHQRKLMGDLSALLGERIANFPMVSGTTTTLNEVTSIVAPREMSKEERAIERERISPSPRVEDDE
jgi:hypothetical protein